MPTTVSRALVSNRPFMVLLVARTLSMVAMAFVPIALAFGILALPGADAGDLSLVLACQLAPTVAFMLVGGVVADRYPRRAVLLVGESLEAVGSGGIGVVMLAGPSPVWALCALAAVGGVGGAMVYPALTGIVPDLVPDKFRHTANAWLSMGASAARLGGLVAGGATVVWIGGGWAMVAGGLLFAVAGVLMLGVPRVRGSLAGVDEHPLRQLVDGWGEFVSRQWLWVVVVQFAVLLMVLQAAQGVLGPVVAKTELGGAAAWATTLAGEAVGGIVGVSVALVWHPARPILVATLLTATSAVPPLLLGISAPLPAVVASMALMGAAFEIFGVLWLTTMQNEVPAESLSRVASYDALGSLMLGPLGLVLAGPAILAFGAHRSLVGAAMISLTTTVLALCSPGVRGLRARMPVAAADG